jgi:hypothetical protein
MIHSYLLKLGITWAPGVELVTLRTNVHAMGRETCHRDCMVQVASHWGEGRGLRRDTPPSRIFERGGEWSEMEAGRLEVGWAYYDSSILGFSEYSALA